MSVTTASVVWETVIMVRLVSEPVRTVTGATRVSMHVTQDVLHVTEEPETNARHANRASLTTGKTNLVHGVAPTIAKHVN